MFKTKNVQVGGVVLERDRTVFKENNWRGRIAREVIVQAVFKNSGKILDSESIVIQRPTKKRIWQAVKEFLYLAEHIPIEIMVKDKEIVIRDGSKIVTEVESVREELKSHEIQV